MFAFNKILKVFLDEYKSSESNWHVCYKCKICNNGVVKNPYNYEITPCCGHENKNIKINWEKIAERYNEKTNNYEYKKIEK